MPMNHRRSMKKLIPWIIGLSTMVVVLLGYLVDLPALKRFELLYQDAHFQVRGPLQAGPEVFIAAIDEKSIDQLGRWPWPRKMMARLIDKLVEHQVKVIAFDMVFSSTDESSGKQDLIQISEQLKTKFADKPLVDSILNPLIENADNDAKFAASLKQSRRSVLGYFFHFDSAGLDHLTEQDLKSYLKNIKSSKFNGFIKSPGDLDLSTIDFNTGYAIESSVPVISESARRAGYFNFDRDSDGTLSKLALIVKYWDQTAEKNYFLPL